ncbi:MAG: hypothetical protein VW405_14600 [Rhodospirillaceae bacterium]
MGEHDGTTSGARGLPTRLDVRIASGGEENILLEEQATLSQDFGESDIQIIDLPNGMMININRFVPTQEMTLAFDPMDGKPRMVSIMLLAGEALLRYPTGEEYLFT